MLKKDLIARVAASQSMSQRQAEAAVDVIFDAMRKALARNETIEFRGFGRFQVREYKEYIGRNPKTHAAIRIRPTRSVLFRTGKDLYEKLNAPRAEEKKVEEKKVVKAAKSADVPVFAQAGGAP